jgi:hypothetical protein
LSTCRLTVLVVPEIHGTWTARALEHDLTAEGRSIEAAVNLLVNIAHAHIAYDRRHNREPLSAFAPAPRLYWKAFERAPRLPIEMAHDQTHGIRTHVTVAVAPEHPALIRLPHIARTA